MIQKLMGQSKKSNTTIMIVVLLLSIMIIGTFLIVYLISNVDSVPDNNIEKIKLYLKAEDSITNIPIISNYYIISENKTYEKTGVLNANSYAELIVPKNIKLYVYCWSNDSYLSSSENTVSNRENELNKTVHICKLDKIGNLKFSYIKNKVNTQLNITSVNGYYNKLTLCYKWTAGILDVNIKDNIAICDQDSWKNYTKYYPENNSYTYLPKNQYICENNIESCETAIGKRCLLSKIEVIDRYQKKVDKCQSTGKSIGNDETITLNLNIEEMDITNSMDYVQIYFVDYDRRYNGHDLVWKNDFDDNDYNVVLKTEYNIFPLPKGRGI